MAREEHGKIETSKLLEALVLTKPGQAFSHSGEEVFIQSNCYAFKGDRVFTYNDEVSVSVPLEIGFEGSVPANEFYALISKVKDKEIFLAPKKGELIVSGRRVEAGLKMMDMNIPVENLGEVKRWIPLSEGFLEALKLCIPSASKDMSKPVLTCLHLNKDCIESCDSFRLTRCEMNSKIKSPILLPATEAKHVGGFSPIKYGTTEGWVHFLNEKEVVISCRTQEGKFPDLSKFLEEGGEEITFPNKLIDMLERAEVFAVEDVEGIKKVILDLDGKFLKMRCEGPTGWIEEKGRVQYKGDKITLHVNPSHLKEILKRLTAAKLTENLLRFEGEGFYHCTALIEHEGSR